MTKFIKKLNSIILDNVSSDQNIYIYDRIPIALALRKELKSDKLDQDGIEIEVGDLLKNFKPFGIKKFPIIEGEGFSLELRIPNLNQENKFLTLCIDELKKSNVEDFGKNLSIVLTYEIPKFIESFKFGENES